MYSYVSMDSLELLRALIAIPAPPGQERDLARYLGGLVQGMNRESHVDAKGNLLVPLGDGPFRIVVTAHMDEIALLVRRVEPDGTLKVTSLGGLYPWKLGEGPVDVLAPSGTIPGVLGFGSIHTNDPASRVQHAREKPLEWASASVFTGLTAETLGEIGVRPGTRVVVGGSRRGLVSLGDFVAGHFLDDRADLVAWVEAIQTLGRCDGVLFAATAAEEVGGEGAQWLLHETHPEICIALELSPMVPDAPSTLNASPSIWAHDGYAAPAVADLDLVADVARSIEMPIQFQAFSRGGSDASCAASKGLCARPFTLGLPMENSHGFEIMHRDAMANLAKLTVFLVQRLLG
ncbi:MAG: hypothetical protein P4L46_26000 [Fimbriimonas sp.]|nr:hypothetical protein [Fimbriimonas sp.]